VPPRQQGTAKPRGAGAARQVFDEALRKSVPHVTRWWLTLAHQPAFAAVLGEVKLCEQPMAFAPAKKDAGGKADGAAREAAPKKEKAPKKEPAPKVRRAGRPDPLPLARPGALPSGALGRPLPRAPCSKGPIAPASART
jgi:hypothetical protein